MSIISFQPVNKSFTEMMLSRSLYKVPPFQRDYSWDFDEWEDLWEDIMGLFGPDPEIEHYMGYLILQSTDNNHLTIIDGQQRITTLSILILAVLSHMKEMIEKGIDSENNIKRSDKLRNDYIGNLDPVSLMSNSKLELNRHNNFFYQNYLVPLQKIPGRRFNYSERLMKKAFTYFHELIGKTFTDNGEKLADFIVKVCEKLVFTIITVNDELNAFKVFETLNARGVRLSSTDLLKNYLFSIIYSAGTHESEFRNLEDKWEKITGVLGSQRFPEFLRVYWNSKNPFIRKTELFKTIKKSIKTREDAFAIIRELDEDSGTYAALTEPYNEQWDRETRQNLSLLKTFNVRLPHSLLLSAYRSFYETDKELFNKILKTVVVITFRYNVICNQLTGYQEKAYNKIALEISEGKLRNISAIKRALKDVYPEDKSFETLFAEKELRTTTGRNKKVVRYILFELEKYYSGQDYDFESSKYNIEHILPKNPGDQWPAFGDNQDERFIYRLGNMTIMKSDANKNLGSSSYDKKIEAYRSSEFAVTKELFDDYKEWNPHNLIARQEKMAKKALEIWNVDFNS